MILCQVSYFECKNYAFYIKGKAIYGNGLIERYKMSLTPGGVFDYYAAAAASPCKMSYYFLELSFKNVILAVPAGYFCSTKV